MSDQRIKFEIKNHIAHITMVRGDKMNALDPAMFKALVEAGEELKASDARVAILSGEGRGFCAGLDMSNFSQMSKGGSASIEADSRKPLSVRTHGVANQAQKSAWTWREAPVPVICAVQGVALGGGFQLMMGADIRYAAPKTRFSIMEIRWGLVPDVGTTHVINRVAREDIVKELTYTGRMFESDEALEYGFITSIHADPLAKARETAEYIASRNPDAIRGIKKLYNQPADRFATDTIQLESAIQDGVISQPNQVEAVRAELEQRPASYK